MTDEMSILREYVRTRGEAAFRCLVERYINIVYAAARRQTGDGHMAEDVTQAVFTILVQKAHAVPVNRPLSAWLLKTTGYCASNARRARERRVAYESRAAAMNQASNNGSSASDEGDWEAIAPMLDEALGRLRSQDRDLVLGRFFEGRSVEQIAAGLGVSQDVAAKRLSRAVEQLRQFFQGRGVTVAAGVLAPLLVSKVSEAAPAGLVSAVSALSTGAASSVTAAAIAKGAWIMTMTGKVKVAIVAAMLLIGGTVITVVTVELSPRGPESAPALAMEPIAVPMSLPLPAEAPGKWAVAFSDGNVVDVVGVRQGAQWWGPDGREMGDPRVDLHNDRTMGYGMAEQMTIQNRVNSGRARAVSVTLRMKGPANVGKNLVLEVEPMSEISPIVKEDDDETTKIFFFAVPVNYDTVKLRLGMAKGPWVDKVLYDAAGGPVADDGGTSVGSITEIDNPTHDERLLVNVQTQVQVLDLRNSPEHERAVVAMVGGKAYTAWRMDDQGPFLGTVYTFGCEKKQMDQVIFRERLCEWKEMKNVSVRLTSTPTEVQVVSGGR